MVSIAPRLGAAISGVKVPRAQARRPDVPPLTLAQLRDDAALTPERFMSYFADFEFQLRTPWLYASEFTYQTNATRFGRIVFAKAGDQNVPVTPPADTRHTGLTKSDAPL
jgi:hypothetical protein